MLKLWIVGSESQIGKAILAVLDPMKYEVFCTDREELDITDTENVLSYGEINRPDIIINCAAVTDSKRCEENPELAYRVNALGARNLSLVARKHNAKIVQLSTDDVFDGTKETPYTEFDPTHPMTVYGRSKQAGENYVKEFTHKHFIVRSTWVYGEGKNFVNALLQSAETEKEVSIPTDQIGSPTSAKDLARLILHLIDTNEYGTYHATCKGHCSRFAFAEEILRLSGKSLKLNPALAKDVPTARPNNAVLDNFILRIIDLYDMPTWQESLKEYLEG